MKNDSGIKFYVKVAGTLFIISTIVAVMLAFVNALTVNKIDENQLKEKEIAIRTIFTDTDNISKIDDEFEIPVKEVYIVSNAGVVQGYCVNVTPIGFGGEINMMVGVNIDRIVKGVQIVSLSETPGLGSKVNDEKYLSNYNSKAHEIKLNESNGIDAISGATISSKAVLLGVNTALALYDGIDLNKIPISENTEIVTDETLEVTLDTIPEIQTGETIPVTETTSTTEATNTNE